MQAAALGDEETPAWAQNFNLAQIAKEGCNMAKIRLGFEKFTKNIVISCICTTAFPIPS